MAMKTEASYGRAFYAEQMSGSLRSARIVAPMVTSLLRPRSVLDLGCGLGTWLAAFLELGVEDVLGVDGAYVLENELMIPRQRFLAGNLVEPLRLDRRFDLAMSLEVAEHLPKRAAATFVSSLTSHADAVLFSAAIPHQFGIGHENEQWPEYWADLFAGQSFLPIDFVRPKIWYNDAVEWWYRQNIILYVSRYRMTREPRLGEMYEKTRSRPLSTVHPRHFLAVRPPNPMPLLALVREMAGTVKARLLGREELVRHPPERPTSSVYDSKVES